MLGKQIIVVAYYFPPLVGIASERASSMVRHLESLHWEPTVITPRSGFYHQVEDDVPAGRVIRTRSLEISRLLRAVYTRDARDWDRTGTIRGVQAGRMGDAVRRFLRDFVYVPDAQVGWVPFAMHAARRALAAGPVPGVIYSTSVPYSAHLAAMGAARRAGCPWVAEFRDPWASGTSPNRSDRRVRRGVDSALEQVILRRADHVIVTTRSHRRELLERYPDVPPERLSVITNGFDPIPQRAVPPRHAPMTILYAGTVSAGEDMSQVLRALDDLEARRPGEFRLRVLGPPEAWRDPAGPTARRPWLELDGLVSPAKAREAMAESSALLHVQCHPAYRNVLPGKLFEYIGVRRTIIAVCPQSTDMGTLLTSHADVRFVSPDNVERLAMTIEGLLEEHAAGSLQQVRVDEAVTAPLRRSEQAARLGSILDRLLDRVPRR